MLAVPGILVVLLMAALQAGQWPILSRAGNLIFDNYQRVHPRPYRDVPVRIVDIDDETIRRFGQWPWPRTDVARLTNRLGDAGASTIAFDIVFSEPDRTSPVRIAEGLKRNGGVAAEQLAALRSLPDGDAVLASALAETPSVTGYFLTRDGKGKTIEPKAGIAVSGSTRVEAVPAYSNVIPPLKPLMDAASGNGFVSLIGDQDGIVRKAPLLSQMNGTLLPSLALDALRTAQGAGSIVVKTSDGSGEMGGGTGGAVVSIKVGNFQVPTTQAGELWMYFTARNDARIVPAWKILSGSLSPKAMSQLFGGHIVFLGAGAVGLRDLIATPAQERELGVMIHAQAVEQMILGDYLVRPDWAVGLERTLLLVFGIGMAAMLPRLGAAKGALLGLALVGGTIGGSWYAFRVHQFLLDPTYPVLGLTLAYGVGTLFAYYREERQRAYIHRAFDRYLSPELVRRIARDPGQLELGGEEREMTVLFCDVRNFSRISESLNPREIIRFLIALLTPMCDVLLDSKATIDKFIGDSILAFWNAPLDDPDQHQNAARAALRMVARLKALNPKMMAQTTEPWPGDVRIGIGLNSGPCCVGNMGSAQRLSYTLIGDTVNLASRIEGLTKYYGVEIAIGSALADRLHRFALIELDRVRVVGRETPETVFSLRGDEKVAELVSFKAFFARHAQMLSAYRAQEWDLAAVMLDELEDEPEAAGLAKLYGLYRDRVLHFAKMSPGTDWDGVFAATDK